MEKIKIRCIIFSMLFFISQMNSLMAQTFTGKLLSAADSTAVAYAHIGVPELGIGTISNQAGEFAFYNKAGTKDSILISHLTHEKIKLRLTQNINDTVIYIEPLENELNTVMVVPADSVNKWFLKAVKNIGKNYPRKLHFFDAFYRETQYEGEKREKYTRLIEADISVQDRSYRQSDNHIRILINQLRKSDDNAKKILFVRLLERVFGERNHLNDILRYPPIRSGNRLRGVASRIKKKQKDAVLQVIKKMKNSNKGYVYVLEMRNTFSETNNWYSIYRFYIDITDYAFIRIDTEEYLGGFLNNSFTSQYIKVDDTYYPSFLMRKTLAGKRVSIKDRGMSYSESILFVNAHYRKKQHDKIRNRFKLDVENDLYETQYPYDPLFWKNYNMLLREPLKKKVVTDLTKDNSLNEQFMQNGKN